MLGVLPLPNPLPLGEGAWPSACAPDSFSLKEKVAEGRMRVKRRIFFCKGHCLIAGLITSGGCLVSGGQLHDGFFAELVSGEFAGDDALVHD